MSLERSVDELDDSMDDALGMDHNVDGVVDAADYTVWRDNLGSTADLRADGDGSGMVGEEDFQFWRRHFGESYASDTSAAVNIPEPSTLVGAIQLLFLMTITRAWPSLPATGVM